MEITVLIAIVAGVSALLGVLVAQAVAMLQSWLDRRNKREILLRTKYEELGQHFLASIEMPGRLMKCTTHEEIQGALHQTAASQAQLLALIYFRPLREPIRRYIASYQNLCLATTTIYYQRPDGQVVGERVHGHPDYQVAMDAHVSERENLATEIENHAPTYAKS